MGPIALFDKSFLQSLTVDESVLFDHFFYPVICPLFYVETLADLEKAVRQGRTPEQEVGIIARKTPEMHGGPCIYHTQLALANLMGHDVPMHGSIPVAGGRPVKTKGKTGIVYKESPESEAFSRWQRGEFLQVERQFAKGWRTALDSLDLSAVVAGMRAMGIETKTCKSLTEAKQMADSFVSDKDKPFDRLKLALVILGIPLTYERSILERWQIYGYPALLDYAPYAAYVMSVEIFFQIALGAQLIATERASNRIDIAYICYLPFCMVFISSDKLHRHCATLFLRSDQTFVWGQDLKEDLKRLNEHYMMLPESQKEKGIMRLAPIPPMEGEYLIRKLWDRHLRPSWRDRPENPLPRDPEKDRDLVDHFKQFTKANPLQPGQIDFDPRDADVLTIERRVSKKKGSWWQLPKDLK